MDFREASVVTHLVQQPDFTSPWPLGQICYATEVAHDYRDEECRNRGMHSPKTDFLLILQVRCPPPQLGWAKQQHELGPYGQLPRWPASLNQGGDDRIPNAERTNRSRVGERLLLVTVSFDMVGYSSMICQDDVGTIEQLRILRSELIDPSIERYRGLLIHTAGDSIACHLH